MVCVRVVYARAWGVVLAWCMCDVWYVYLWCNVCAGIRLMGCVCTRTCGVCRWGVCVGGACDDVRMVCAVCLRVLWVWYLWCSCVCGVCGVGMVYV